MRLLITLQLAFYTTNSINEVVENGLRMVDVDTKAHLQAFVCVIFVVHHLMEDFLFQCSLTLLDWYSWSNMHCLITLSFSGIPLNL